MKRKVLDAILAILADKRADGDVLPFATSIEVAHLLKMNAQEVEKLAKGIEGIVKGKTANHEYYYEGIQQHPGQNWVSNNSIGHSNAPQCPAYLRVSKSDCVRLVP